MGTKAQAVLSDSPEGLSWGEEGVSLLVGVKDGRDKNGGSLISLKGLRPVSMSWG